MRLLGTIGLAVTLSYFIGFVFVLVGIPSTYTELHNMSIAGFNIEGLSRSWLPSTTYAVVGALDIAFCACLFLAIPNRPLSVIGKIFLLLGGILWFSFGTVAYDPMKDVATTLFLIRLILLIITIFLGLLLFAVSLDSLTKDKVLTWLTAICGIIIMILAISSVLVPSNVTWTRTNAAITVYFSWFGLFGLKVLSSKAIRFT